MIHTFEQHIPEARRQLLKYAKSLTRSDPEDLVQDTFSKALLYWKDGNFVQFISWAKQTLFTTFIDQERRRQTWDHNLPLLTAGMNRLARFEEEDAIGAVESGVRLRDAKRAWDALPEHYRVMLRTVDFDGLTYRQAADALDLKIGTVMSRLSRARATMERYIDVGVPA